MRTAIAAAAFAAGALAVPAHRHLHNHKRDVVIDYDYVTVTDVVTVTAGEPLPSSTSSAEVSANINNAPPSSWTRHHWWTWTSSAEASTAAPTSTEAPSSTEAPTSSAAPTSQAPPPSSYQAPTTSTKAPATTAAPSTWATSTSEAPSPTSTQAASSSLGAAPTDYSGLAVYHHNLHRSNHSAPDIEWDDGLASTAETIASSCVYAHNVDANGGGYGQNIAAGVESNNISAIITDLFYNGEVGWYQGLYGEANPDMTNFEHWGHFSQIVWKATTKVGCYTYDCTSKGLQNVGSDVAPYFTVCNYESPGNYAGEYGDNIGTPLGADTAQWNTGSS